MHISRAAAVLLASIPLLAGCANGADDPAPTGSASSADASASSPGTSGPTARSSADSTAPAVGLVLRTASGTTTTLELTDVYCSGTPGDLHHLIGKTDHRPPLVEVTPGEFAMVKLGDDRPYTSSAPSGITVEQDGVTFAGTTLGDATLEGTVTCTQWEG